LGLPCGGAGGAACGELFGAPLGGCAFGVDSVVVVGGLLAGGEPAEAGRSCIGGGGPCGGGP